MANWSETDLKAEFGAAKNNGWLGYFRESASTYGFPVEVLLALASRETNMRNIVGDGGHGHGVMQIDDRSYPEWCRSGTWQNVKAAIDKGASVLDGKRKQVVEGQGKDLKVAGTSFHGQPGLSADDIQRIMIAAYNSGLWAYYSFSTRGDPDLRTTHRDYSADTLKRAAVFAHLLG